MRPSSVSGKPTDAIVYYNLSLTLQDLDRWQEALHMRLGAEALGLALDEALTGQEEAVACEDRPTIRHTIPILQAAGTASRKLRAVSSESQVQLEWGSRKQISMTPGRPVELRR